MSDIFISYSRRDKEFVEQLHEALKADGRDSWVDWEDIPSAAEWLKEIYTGIEQANTFAFVISPDSVQSEICSLEINFAIENNKRLIPIMYRELVDEADKKALHPSISSHNWIFFREGDDFDESFTLLSMTLDTDLEYLRAHTRLLIRAVEWNARNRDASLLLRGSELSETLAWLEANAEADPRPTELQQTYVIAGQRAHVARRRAIVLTATYSLIVLLLAIFAAFQAVNAENRRQEAVAAEAVAQFNAEQAQSLALASSAQQALYRDNQPGLAIALVLVANQIDEPSPLAQSVLAQAAYSPGARLVKSGFVTGLSYIDVSPDGGRALAIDEDNQLVLWDVNTGDDLHAWPHEDAILQTIGFSPDGEQVIAIEAGEEANAGRLIVYDTATYELVHNNNGIAGARDMHFLPDGSILIGADSGDLIIYDTATGEELKRLAGHEDTIWSTAVNPAGRYAAASYNDGSFRVWDVDSGEELAHINPQIGSAWAIDITPDGTRVLVGYSDFTVRLWDWAAEQEIYRMVGHTNHVWDLAISPNGQTAVSASYDSNVIHWNLATGEIIRRFYGHATRIYGVKYLSDGRRFVSGSADGTLRVWDTINGAEIGDFREQTSSIWGVDFLQLPDGDLTVASASADGTVVWRNLTTGEIIRRFRDGDSAVFDVKFSPDGTRLLTGSSVANESALTLWNLETGERVHMFEGHMDNVRSVDFSPDGSLIISAGRDRNIILWDLETMEEIRRVDLLDGGVWSVAFSPDGETFLAGIASNEAPLVLFDTETAQPIAQLEGHLGVVYSVDFSPDGTRALSSSEDGSVRLWDMETYQSIRRFDGHTGDVNSVAFSPDMRSAISGSDDLTVRLWDLESGAEIGRLEGHTGLVLSSMFAPDGSTAISGGRDGVLRHWRVASLEELLDWVHRNRAIPELTCEQRELFAVEPLCEQPES